MSKNPGDYPGMVDPVNAYVCSCIRRIRIDQGLTVAQMAARIGIPLGSYSCLETARYRLSLNNLLRCLLALGVPIREVWPQRAAKQEPVPQVDEGCIQAVVEEARRRQPPRIGLQDVIEAVCEEYEVTCKELSGSSRARHLAEARMVAALLVREQRHLTQVALSHRLKRDVSSLSHCLRRLKQRKDRNRWIGRRVDRVGPPQAAGREGGGSLGRQAPIQEGVASWEILDGDATQDRGIPAHGAWLVLRGRRSVQGGNHQPGFGYRPPWPGSSRI